MTLQIDGSNGKYDNLINDKSVKYAKNAVDNYHEYMQAPLLNDNNSTPPVFDFSVHEFCPPRQFSFSFLPHKALW